MRLPKLLVLSALFFVAAGDGPTAAPTYLTTEDQHEPIGIQDSKPEFAWQMLSDKPNTLQHAYQIQAASDPLLLQKNTPDLWDSGQVLERRNGGIEYRGKTLTSGKRVYWRVRTWDDQRNLSAFSSPASFEVGLLANSDWKAKWIWRERDTETDATYFRKIFKLPKGTIATARLYMSASQHAIAYVNGKSVGRASSLAPGEQTIYQTLPIDSLVRDGDKNVIAILGQWFGSGQGRPALRPGLLAQIIVTYTDGSQVSIGTDETWKTLPGEWYFQKNSSGQSLKFINDEAVPAENLDGRKHPRHWNDVKFDAHNWKKALVIGTPPNSPWTGSLTSSEVVIEESLIQGEPLKGGSSPGHIVDFGRVLVGAPVVRLEGVKPGTKITFKRGYRLDESGSVIPFTQKTDLQSEYISAGGQEEFRPLWYLGFRYLEVQPLTKGVRAPISILTRHARMPSTKATFESSDPLLNRIWELAAHSALFSAQEQFVDTPTREQAQFVYDSYLIGSALSWLYGERDLNQQALKGFAHSQERYQPVSGKLDAVYPNGEVLQDIADWTMVWIPWIWDYYTESEDIELVKEIYPSALKTAQWIEGTLEKKSSLVDLGNTLESSAGLLDWPDRYELDLKPQKRTIMSLNGWAALQSFAKISAAIGNTQNEKHFKEVADKISKSVNERLWLKDRGVYSDGILPDGSLSNSASQQTNAMISALGIAPPERASQVLEHIRSKGFKSSIIMSRFLVEAYGDGDREAELFDFLRNENGLNYASILKDGGTFTYENWLGRKKSSENSESHGMGSYSALLALRRYVVGIASVDPQYKRVVLRPHLFDLKYVNATFPTPQGELKIKIVQHGEKSNLIISVPANMVVEFKPVHDSAVTIGSGEHEIEFKR